MITITRAPPYLTVQDWGRKGSRAAGVPQSGAMDSFALRTANALAGNQLDAAGLEWALGGGSIRFENDAVFSLAGAKAHATICREGGDAVHDHLCQFGRRAQYRAAPERPVSLPRRKGRH